jgi:hypothetical protein
MDPLQMLDPVTELDDKAVRVEGLCWSKNSKPDVWEVNGVAYSSDGGAVPSDWSNGWTSRPCWFHQYFSVLPDGSVQMLDVYPAVQGGTVVADTCLASLTLNGQFNIN